MKTAEAQDAWRHALERDRGFRVSRIQASGKPPLRDFDASLPNGVTVVCGLNGVGKTTLLRLLSSVLDDQTPGADDRHHLFEGGDFVVTVKMGQRDVELSAEARPEEVRAGTYDAFAQCMRLLATAAQPNFDDLREGIEPRALSEAELEAVEYVVGKRYDSVVVSEIEDTAFESSLTLEETLAVDTDDKVLPVFEVQVGDLSYDFRTMGLGELAVFVLLWNFWRVAPGSVVLLEEPETFLSSRATVALLDVLAELVHRKRLYAVVTTHSPSLAASVPLDALRVLIPTGLGEGLRAPTSRAELDLILGAHAGMARVIIVEDRTARLFVSELVGRFKGIWGRSVEVREVGGAQTVTQLCATFPKCDRIRLVGVLDGDQAAPPESRWPVLTLPGPSNPDALLRDAVIGDIHAFADALGRDRETVTTAQAAISGLDAHDWFPRLASDLGIEATSALRAAVGVWLNQEGNALGARAIADDVETALGS